LNSEPEAQNPAPPSRSTAGGYVKKQAGWHESIRGRFGLGGTHPANIFSQQAWARVKGFYANFTNLKEATVL
jgi:hypothetical protein